MAEYSLLERLARTADLGPRAKPNADAPAESVARNLRRLFNARQGCAQARPDLGMPDFGESAYGFPSALPEIIRAIKFQIEQFEPRLRNVQVRHDTDHDDPQTVRFSIRADLVISDEIAPIRFSGVLGGDGHIDVRA